MKRTFLSLFALAFLLGSGWLMPVEAQTQKDSSVSVFRWDDANAARWDADFKVVDIPSKTGGDPQKAYIYKASEAKRPLIVSLHTWSGDYRQADPLAAEAKAKDYNYIHPDFQGANTRPEAMGSELVVKNLQEAIEYAVKATEANPQEVHVIGVSGGGMAALLAYMNVTCAVKSFSAWAPIADLEAWYWESKTRGNKYADHIWKATSSSGTTFNAAEARRRSPLYGVIPRKQRRTSHLYIYEGVHDGYTGSVPVTHAINMYNRVVGDWKYGLSQSEAANRQAFVHADMVSEDEIVRLLSLRCEPKADPERKLGDRQIHLEREASNTHLVIFEGTHEMLPCALELLPIGE